MSIVNRAYFKTTIFYSILFLFLCSFLKLLNRNFIFKKIKDSPELGLHLSTLSRSSTIYALHVNFYKYKKHFPRTYYHMRTLVIQVKKRDRVITQFVLMYIPCLI
jgi:hypothetical protein